MTAAAADAATIARLRTALLRAFADSALEAARADLLLGGIAVLPCAAYARIKAFERFAARRGYPTLA